MTTFSMKTNPLREKIDSGGPFFGLFVSELYTPWLGTILDAAHYDFCIFDMEHGAFAPPQISAMIAGFSGSRCTPIVRIPGVRREIVLTVMDLGVAGIMVPGVETADEVRRCVEVMKYPPLGSRGLSFSRPHSSFDSPDRDEYLRKANERTLLVVQIETGRALDHLDEILAVPGLDAVFVGCADLSLAMGVPNDPSQGPLREALERVLKAATARNIVVGANLASPSLVEDLLPLGMRMITCTTDTKGFLEGISRPLRNMPCFKK